MRTKKLSEQEIIQDIFATACDMAESAGIEPQEFFKMLTTISAGAFGFGSKEVVAFCALIKKVEKRTKRNA